MAKHSEKEYKKNTFKDVVDLKTINVFVLVNLFSSYTVLRNIFLFLKTACKFARFVNPINVFASVLLKIL